MKISLPILTILVGFVTAMPMEIGTEEYLPSSWEGDVLDKRMVPFEEPATINLYRSEINSMVSSPFTFPLSSLQPGMTLMTGNPVVGTWILNFQKCGNTINFKTCCLDCPSPQKMGRMDLSW